MAGQTWRKPAAKTSQHSIAPWRALPKSFANYLGRSAFEAYPCQQPWVLSNRDFPPSSFVAARNSPPIIGLALACGFRVRKSNYAPCRAFAPCVLLSKPHDAGFAGVRCLRFFSPPLSVHARQSHSCPFEQAQQIRQALEARPQPHRTRPGYERVLDAYRVIYHHDPASPKADASVLAVAQLLLEEGRLFSDEKLLHDALGQYEFLRMQYPANHYHVPIAEGEKQAHAALNAMQHAAARSPIVVHQKHNAVLAAAIQSQEEPPPGRAMTPPPIQPQKASVLTRPPPAMTPAAIQPVAPQEVPLAAPVGLNTGRVALVSGIRHWSTPVYTRIAIDLQDEVSYQAARVPGPDRIYFDLYGARLESALNGKSVEVIDDGFLKRIRAAQFSNNVTRIVLDVSSVSDYSAFLLPNPWRLIIDIHGLKPGTSQTTNLASLPPSSRQTAPTPVPFVPSRAAVANSLSPALRTPRLQGLVQAHRRSQRSANSQTGSKLPNVRPPAPS